MADIHFYRKIVALQAEIIEASRRNSQLEERCKRLQAELIQRHQRQKRGRKVSASPDIRARDAESARSWWITLRGLRLMFARLW